MHSQYAVMRALQDVEEVPSGKSGFLLYGADASSTVVVMVHDRKIGWAAATARQRRLSHRLAEAASDTLPEATIDMVLETCRRTGSYLGEWLLDRGLIDEHTLERCLVDHTVSALAELQVGMGRPVWCALPETKAPRHTIAAGLVRDLMVEPPSVAA